MGADEQRRRRRQTLGFRPLYRQVRDVLVKRIADGVWQAGQALPSEPEIARGSRRQPGHGAQGARRDDGREPRRAPPGARHLSWPSMTTRASCSSSSSWCPIHGERSFPDSRVLAVADRHSDANAAAILGLRPRESVLRIDRVRLIARTRPACWSESICRPRSFPAWRSATCRTTSTSSMRTEFGITIGRASEKLKAVAADEPEASILGAPARNAAAAGRPHCLRPRRPPRGVARLALPTPTTIHYWSDLR